MLMLRSMSPQIIAVDELGKKADFQAVEQAVCSECVFLVRSMRIRWKNYGRKPYLKKWMKRGIFKRFILIRRSRSGEREFQVFNGKREKIMLKTDRWYFSCGFRSRTCRKHDR